MNNTCFRGQLFSTSLHFFRSFHAEVQGALQNKTKLQSHKNMMKISKTEKIYNSAKEYDVYRTFLT